jgi:hypothetical protein
MPDPESYVTDSSGGPPHDGIQPQAASGEQDRLDQIKTAWFDGGLHRAEYWADLASRDIPWLIGECDIRRAWNASLHSQLAASKTDVERLEGLLRRLEWAGTICDGEEPCCPVCRGIRELPGPNQVMAELGIEQFPDPRRPGHDPDCWLAAELGR